MTLEDKFEATKIKHSKVACQMTGWSTKS